MRDHDKLVSRQLERDKGGVGPAFQDGAIKRPRQDEAIELDGRLDDYAQLDARMATRELSQVTRQVVGCAGGARAYVKGAGLQVLHPLGGVIHHLDGTQGGAARVGERTSRIGETNPSTVSLEELQPDRPLEVPDL